MKSVQKKLAEKIGRYKKSLSLSNWDRSVLHRECRRLEKKLGVERILPKEYVFLRKIRESLVSGDDINLKLLAEASGYPRWQASRPEVTILRDISPKLYKEMVGFDEKDVEMELVKLMKQDDDLGVKARALDLATKILGMQGEEKGVQINVVGAIEVAD